jgi:hypothetical protein
MRTRNGFAKFVRGLSEPHPVALSEKHPRKAKSRQPLIPEQKALRRHRGPQSCPISANRSTNHRGHAPDQFRGNLPTKTEIVTALPSYIGQRLSDIRRGWCPSRSPSKRGREGSPFRRKRSSPPVVECAVSIGAGSPSQGETTADEALPRLATCNSSSPTPATQPGFGSRPTSRNWPAFTVFNYLIRGG